MYLSIIWNFRNVGNVGNWEKSRRGRIMIKKINGLSINYSVEGEGEPIMVLHGWGCNINTVLSIVNILKDRYRVYALDLPGFGESEEPKEAIGSFEYAEIVKGFMIDEGIERASFIGHSLGGK